MATRNPLLDQIESATQLQLDPKVLTKVGLIMVPDALIPHGAALVEGSAAVYSSGRKILQTFGREMANMIEADTAMRQAIPGSGQVVEMTPGSNVVRNTVPAEFFEQHEIARQNSFTRAGKTLDRERKVIAESLAALDTEINAKLNDPLRSNAARVQEAAEVRAHIRSLKKEDRQQAVAHLISEGDRVSVAAIIHSPPVITGLSPAQLQTLKAMAAKTLEPSLDARRIATMAVLTHVNNAADQFVNRFKSMTPRRPDTIPSLTASLTKLNNGPEDHAA